MTTVTHAYGPGDRVALTVRLTDDRGDWIAHPGDIGEIMQVIPGIERGTCKCDGPVYAVHFEHIPHANLEHVCHDMIEAAEDESEAVVIDQGPGEIVTRSDGSQSDPNFWRFIVPMTLSVTAATKAEALDKAMRWRDAIGMSGDPSAALTALGFDWHLHHPWGC